MTFGNFKAFIEDLDSTKYFLEQIVTIGDLLKLQISSAARSFGENPEIEIIGSTNPNRLTCVVDPLTPDQRYPSDFDIHITWQHEIDDETKKDYLRQMFPEGDIVICKDGRIDLETELEKYPISATIVTPHELKTDNRYAAANYFTKQVLSEKDKEITRALRLFCMRNGLYGGYTKGMKGVALEEIAKKSNDFKEAIMQVVGQIEANTAIVAPSILDHQKNLCQQVSKDVRLRFLKYGSIFLESDMIRNSPYSIESWQQDHSDMRILALSMDGIDPHKAYLSARAVTEKTLLPYVRDGKRKHSQLVIPHTNKHQEIFIALTPPKPDKAREWYNTFQREWAKGPTLNQE